ncbi:GntR family transcriptional regulator [Sphingomonas sp. SUN019]|uniref:GntR family transcriptional regulator n=1 Tax=Sphingomonas sp. SUN019 TaxID=2937788 RepID=UPI002164CBA1|nr:GntR family transcriptional regulator [Sphingomonas sp. SUN019]UVO50724.1 GntR family transcriptional regulator [Sphingomonas sp. SUN019]
MSRASDRAYGEIKAQILSGALAPGAQLKEEELADICGVSRTPVRDAMHRLEAEMFIQRSDSQRSFVSNWSIDDIEELFTLRTMLESHAAAQAAARVTPEMLVALHRNAAAIDAAIDRPLPDVDTFLVRNAEFHALIIQAAASDRLAHMINRLVLQPIVHRTALRYDADQLRRSLAEHVEIVAALEARDADWARAVMTSHIRRAFHVFQQERTA